MAAGRGGRRRGWALGSLGLAIAARLLAGPLPLNYYDIGYALVWGREILGGHLPDYRTPGASTPHPLATLLATAAAAFGSPGGWYVVQAIIFLSLGVAATALFMLTRTCLERARGGPDDQRRRIATAGAVLAVGALVLSRPFLTDGLGGSGLSDMPALGLVLAAAALIAARSERFPAPLVLLGLAGLMRPEAWGLAGAYWLYLAVVGLPRRDLIAAAGLVAAAPLLWALGDVIVIGDPAYSLTHTQAASETGIFAHGVGQVPSAALRGLRALVGLPVLAVGTLGALAAAVLARRPLAPALVLLGLALAEFAALGVSGVPLLERFLLLAAAMFSLFFAYAVLAGRDRLLARPGRHQRRLGLVWTAAAGVLVLYVAASHVRGDLRVRGDQRAAVRAEADLVTLADRAEVRVALRRCLPFYVPRFTLTSLVAYDFDLPPRSVARTGTRPPARGLVLVPITAAAGRYFGVTPRGLRLLRPFESGPLPLVSQDRSWRLYAAGCPGG